MIKIPEKFENETKLKEWLKNNSESIEEGMKYYDREYHPPEHPNFFIDLVFVDKKMGFVFVEVKNHKFDLDAMRQIFGYYCMMQRYNRGGGYRYMAIGSYIIPEYREILNLLGIEWKKMEKNMELWEYM